MLSTEELEFDLNGAIILEDGVSTIGAAGSYAGTNMTFCDINSPGNDFDNISANSMSINMYTIECTMALASCGCELLCVQPDSPVVSVTDNTCSPVADGFFNVDVDCALGSTIEYSIDGGVTWTLTIPNYNTTSPVTTIARCVDDVDNTCISISSNPAVSSPLTCCQVPDCFGINIIKN